MATSIDASAPGGPEGIILARLDDQARWYGRKSKRAQRLYKTIKVVEIVAAALIPFLTGRAFDHKDAVIGGLGVVITVLEGILQLNQYQQIWTTYRATSEALTHEKYLFLALAGPYATAGIDPPVLLAERIEAIMSQENTKWVSLQEQREKKQAPDSKGA
ncbi:MAG: DUF4231 domain-containing protein [Silvibacterium sp.]|nr:DUF4231 domain-containing protein [Silvibacterium sp.]MBV8436223.1 DUF4231 domain-containing protein [Silvibacterium sp.]